MTSSISLRVLRSSKSIHPNNFNISKIETKEILNKNMSKNWHKVIHKDFKIRNCKTAKKATTMDMEQVITDWIQM